MKGINYKLSDVKKYFTRDVEDSENQTIYGSMVYAEDINGGCYLKLNNNALK